MTYAKIILIAYPYIEDACRLIDSQIEKRSRLSFYSYKPCEKLAEKIADMIADKRYLLLLKSKVSALIQRLTEEEKRLIGYKYFNNRPIEGFDYKSRQYFRKQVKVLDKFQKLLEQVKLTEENFIKYYADIPFIKSISIRLMKLAA